MRLLYRINEWIIIFGSFFYRKVLIASKRGIAIARFESPVASLVETA